MAKTMIDDPTSTRLENKAETKTKTENNKTKITLKVKKKSSQTTLRCTGMCAAAELSRGRTIAPGGVIVRFLSRFGTLEESSANDRPRRCDRSQD
jgi:hypothetical protein